MAGVATSAFTSRAEGRALLPPNILKILAEHEFAVLVFKLQSVVKRFRPISY
jgi:hypothetical protein